jgi:hypothetical protein
MFKLYLRNPQTERMETCYVETCTEAERMCLKAWPDCKVSMAGEVIVFRQSDRGELQKALNLKEVTASYPMVVARVCFQDKV